MWWNHSPETTKVTKMLQIYLRKRAIPCQVRVAMECNPFVLRKRNKLEVMICSKWLPNCELLELPQECIKDGVIFKANINDLNAPRRKCDRPWGLRFSMNGFPSDASIYVYSHSPWEGGRSCISCSISVNACHPSTRSTARHFVMLHRHKKGHFAFKTPFLFLWWHLDKYAFGLIYVEYDFWK